MAEVSLELLQQMFQQLLDGQKMLREDNRNARRRLSRIEHAILGLQRSSLDHTEGEAEIQEQMESLSLRVERLEQRPA